MFRFGKFVVVGFALCALVALTCASSHAGTIIKLSLGSDDDPDIEYDGIALSTVDDGDGGTSGDQNTAVDFLGFLGSFPNILTSTASFTLSGLAPDGPPTVFGGVLVIQDFLGGTLELYDPANTLLLSGSLDTSALTGPLGPPATGGLFTTSFASVTGGAFAPLIDPDTLTLSMSLSGINDAAGFTVTGASLDDFVADATISIGAEPIPEPATWLLLAAGGLFAARCRGRSRA